MKFLIALLWLVGGFALLALLCEMYVFVRRRLNCITVGLVGFLSKLLKRDDYVSIDNRLLRFSHFTVGGEIVDITRPPLWNNKWNSLGDLAFYNENTLGYTILPLSKLEQCEFVIGKYGVKWAASQNWLPKALDIAKKHGIR